LSILLTGVDALLCKHYFFHVTLKKESICEFRWTDRPI